ncbi:hypothetical protein ACFVH6_43840 [Spirillospora sp. NPDC127200]
MSPVPFGEPVDDRGHGAQPLRAHRFQDGGRVVADRVPDHGTKVGVPVGHADDLGPAIRLLAAIASTLALRRAPATA